MPDITVKYKKGVLTPSQISQITPKMQVALAKRLDCHEHPMSPEDSDIEFIERSPTYEGNTEVRIEVLAQDYPSRVYDLVERVNGLTDLLIPIFPKGIKCCCGVTLTRHHGTFFEGEAT
jgi:hypothetical protein